MPIDKDMPIFAQSALMNTQKNIKPKKFRRADNKSQIDEHHPSLESRANKAPSIRSKSQIKGYQIS